MGLFGLKKHQNGDFHIINPQIDNYPQITKLLAKNERFWTIWRFPGQKKPHFWPNHDFMVKNHQQFGDI